MIPNPISKVLSTLRKHEVRCLLMGGQACVLYGAAEFSRDTDLAIHADAETVSRLATAMAELDAEVIAVPPFDRSWLERGHAVHFRCHHPSALHQRVDVMSKMRGVRPFGELWESRSTIQVDGSDDVVEVMGLPDLVRAKKTQRDKDWPMVRRLVDASFLQQDREPTAEAVAFWLRELRTVSLLAEAVRRWPDEAQLTARERPVINTLLGTEPSLQACEDALQAEERQERAADKAYWAPLRAELESLRHGTRRQTPPA